MLDSLFKPRSVAVIGASTKPLSIGNRVIKNLIDFGFKGPVYPINPKADEVRGIKAFASIQDVPDGVDVVHMVIPARFVPQAVEDCGRKKVKNIIINSGGFSEVGPEGAAIEKAFLEKARTYGIRVLGPNCQGIINTDPAVRAYCNFTFTKPDAGHISIVALSGGVAEVIHQAFAAMGVGTRIYASNGNACDITIPEIIRYLGEDDGTRVIVTYVEGLKDAPAFLAAVRDVAVHKPILAMKAGRTREGAKAAASHTGGLAKEDLATDLIFKKAGVLTFTDEGELIQAAAAFASQPTPAGNRVGIITNTGGPAVIATDVLVGAGLVIPPLSERTKKILKEKLFAEASVNNPADVLATGTAEHYRACMDAMLADDGYDALYVNFVTPFFVDTDSIAREIAAVNKRRQKPMVVNLMTDKRQWTETVRILREAAVPFFSLPGEAARALSALVRYRKIKERDPGRPAAFENISKQGAAALLEKAAAAPGAFLDAATTFRLLAAYGIAHAPWRAAATPAEARHAADGMGYPVVLKADAAGIVHKSDMGAVVLNLNDGTAVENAAADMADRFSDASPRFLLQPQLEGGLELIMGAKAEPGLGHILMFGMGGIYVEVLKDVVFHLGPLTDTEAAEMINGVRLSPLFDGLRGQSAVNRRDLMEMLLRLSQLVGDFPQIRELDLNPVLAFEDRVAAVDARIRV